MSYKDDAEELYQSKYAGRGIAPRHVAALKEVLAKALKKGEKPAVAAKAFFKEKGIILKDKEEAKVKEEPEEEPEEKPEKEVKKVVTKETPVVAAPKLEPTKMDRKSLKATIAELKSAGVEIEAKKSDSDGELAGKINDAMFKLASPEALAALKKIDPVKLTKVLSADCMGLFVDLESTACVACGDRAECLKAYLENLKGDFSAFKAAHADIKLEEKAAAVTDEDAVAPKKPTGKVKQTEIKYEAKRRIFVQDIPNPNDPEDAGYEFIQAILDRVPETMKELRDIAEEIYEVESTKLFVNDFVVGLRDSGIIKFFEDLDKEQVQMLREAGVDLKGL